MTPPWQAHGGFFICNYIEIFFALSLCCNGFPCLYLSGMRSNRLGYKLSFCCNGFRCLYLSPNQLGYKLSLYYNGFRCLYGCLHHFFYFFPKMCLRPADNLQAWFCHGMLRYKYGAAILIGQNRRFVSPDFL